MRFVAELRSWLLHQRTQAAEATAKLQAAPVSLLDVERQANTALAEVEAIHRLLDAKPKPTALTAVLADLSVHEDPLPQFGLDELTLSDLPGGPDAITPGKPFGKPPSFETPTAWPAAEASRGAVPMPTPGMLLGQPRLSEVPPAEEWRRALRTRTPKLEDFGIDADLDLSGLAPHAAPAMTTAPLLKAFEAQEPRAESEFVDALSDASPGNPARRLDYEDTISHVDAALYANLPAYVHTACSADAFSAIVAKLRQRRGQQVPEAAVHSLAAEQSVDGAMMLLGLLQAGVLAKHGANYALAVN